MKSSFGSVGKKLSEKQWPSNIRALRIVVEILLEDILKYPEAFRYYDLFEELEQQSALSLTTKLWVECLIKPVLILMRHQHAERMAK